MFTKLASGILALSRHQEAQVRPKSGPRPGFGHVRSKPKSQNLTLARHGYKGASRKTSGEIGYRFFKLGGIFHTVMMTWAASPIGGRRPPLSWPASSLRPLRPDCSPRPSPRLRASRSLHPAPTAPHRRPRRQPWHNRHNRHNRTLVAWSQPATRGSCQTGHRTGQRRPRPGPWLARYGA